MHTVALYTEQQQQIWHYTVCDIHDCIIITTTDRRLALRYFDLAQQYGTVMKVWAVDRFLDSRRRRSR